MCGLIGPRAQLARDLAVNTPQQLPDKLVTQAHPRRLQHHQHLPQRLGGFGIRRRNHLVAHRVRNPVQSGIETKRDLTPHGVAALGKRTANRDLIDERLRVHSIRRDSTAVTGVASRRPPKF
jgi:hypothetical protein